MDRMSKRQDCVVKATRELRGHDKVRLKIKRRKTDIYQKSPIYRGKVVWDELTIQQLKTSLDGFKYSLKND